MSQLHDNTNIVSDTKEVIEPETKREEKVITDMNKPLEDFTLYDYSNYRYGDALDMKQYERLHHAEIIQDLKRLSMSSKEPLDLESDDDRNNYIAFMQSHYGLFDGILLIEMVDSKKKYMRIQTNFSDVYKVPRTMDYAKKLITEMNTGDWFQIWESDCNTYPDWKFIRLCSIDSDLYNFQDCEGSVTRICLPTMIEKIMNGDIKPHRIASF